MRFFCMDAHISVIADFKTANPDVEVVDWCLSGHAHVMNRVRDNPKHINSDTWFRLNQTMIRAFQKEYDSFLSMFDGFITGHVTAFAMIYEKYNKPILAINTCRYDMPFCWNKDLSMLEELHSCLRRMHKLKQLYIVSNNRADQKYTELGTGILPDYNPSLCLYTNAKYNPTKSTFMCYNGELADNELVTPRPSEYKWEEITSYRGIIHFPYETSLMSMFEHYTSGCPLFFPSKQYWKSNPNLNSVVKYWGTLPDYLSEAKSDDFWIDKSDIYEVFQSPNTYYFDSIDHLFELLRAFEYNDDTEFRRNHIEKVKEKWANVISNTLAYTYKTQNPRHLCYNRLPLLANVVFDVNYANTGVSAQHKYPFRYPFLKGDIVFVKTDFLTQVLEKYPINAPITLVTGVSDLSPTRGDCEFILRCENIRNWIGCNIPVSHPKIRKVLIGVGEPERQNGNHDTLKRLHVNRPSWGEKRDELCVPYHSNTHADRQITSTLPKLPFEEYMKEIGKHKFVRCMRGNGLDTHRFSEILLMGSVPVVDHSPLDDLYSQFPCMFNGDDVASFVWDETKYRAFLDMFWLTPCDEKNIIKTTL